MVRVLFLELTLEKMPESRYSKKVERDIMGRQFKKNIRWDRLDNTANVFPVVAGENLTNVYRVSAVLKEDIERDDLQKALEIVIAKFPMFNVRMRTGFFWYYFEENGKAIPAVVEEQQFPCR